MDRAGKAVGTVGKAGRHMNLGLSPDDERLAVSSRASDGNIDIWVYDSTSGGDGIRITDHPGWRT